jgi:hypothetical protein
MALFANKVGVDNWMEQVARNATMQDTGYLNGCRYLLHDRDQKFCREFPSPFNARRLGG